MNEKNPTTLLSVPRPAATAGANRPAPAATQQQLAQQAVERQHGEEHQQCIELRAARLQRELHGEQQQQCGIESGFPIPQPAAQVVHQQQRADAGEQ